MTKKTHHSTRVVVIVLLMMGGICTTTSVNVYGQEQPTSPSTSLSSNQTTDSSSPSSATLAGNYTSSFKLENCNFSTTGSNPYFILQPGYHTVFAGVEDNEPLNMTVTVLNQSQVVGDGIVTRVVQEKVANSQTGELMEITNDWFAICTQTNSVFYFGENVNNYENGKLVDHEGSWQHGSDGARAGLMMPGIVLLGSRYYQEIAPGVALDKSEIVSMNQTVNVPAGTFSDVIKMKETNDLEPDVTEDNLHAPGVGQVIDHGLKLVSYGYIK
ncbi:hypothetical protein BH18THE2_BH18THE2_42040 [soil metagenome]